MITTIRRQVIKQCPFKNEVDVGELAITFAGKALELHALDARIDEIAMGRTSHEDFTVAVRQLLPPGAQVVTTWQTGSWSVECRESTGEAP